MSPLTTHACGIGRLLSAICLFPVSKSGPYYCIKGPQVFWEGDIWNLEYVLLMLSQIGCFGSLPVHKTAAWCDLASYKTSVYQNFT